MTEQSPRPASRAATRPPALRADAEGLSDAALSALREHLTQQIRVAPRAEAEALFNDALLPLEREAVWRQRLADPHPEVELLFITVGAQANTPIAAGLRWDAAHVVL